jgi:acetyltransferase-like isoleucine patch superfamily enzyme
MFTMLTQQLLHIADTALAHHAGRALGEIHKVEARLRGVEIGEDVSIYGRPTLKLAPGAQVVIGAGSSLISSSRRCSTASLHAPVWISASHASSRIRIGPGSSLNGTSIWCRSTEIEIGRNAAIGPNATIMDSPAHALWPPESRNDYDGALDAPVQIGNDVWIGNGALILAGVTIGDNAVVGARSVVTRDVAANTFAAGAPARSVRPLT